MGDVLLALAGDVMTGRGVDQVLRHPGSPQLEEEYVKDARVYVELAERLNGDVPRGVDPTWVWGDTLEPLAAARPAARVMNLETSVTTSEERARGKGIHYRMHPANVECLRAGDVDVWTLANNHLLDHGRAGLAETLHVLHAAGLSTAGAGRDAEEAWTRAEVAVPGGRVLVAAAADGSSGVPSSWAATAGRPGVAMLPDLSPATADAVAARLTRDERPGDLRVASLHWGGNWGYRVPEEQVRFAHRLVDAGVHVVHGHSSHHPRPMEVYRGRLVLYGCGDLVNDYEGIGGYEGFRDDLRLLYLARADRTTGELRELVMLPFQARRLRLWRADREDAAWLAGTLGEACSRFDSSLRLDDDGLLRLRTRG